MMLNSKFFIFQISFRTDEAERRKENCKKVQGEWKLWNQQKHDWSELNKTQQVLLADCMIAPHFIRWLRYSQATNQSHEFSLAGWNSMPSLWQAILHFPCWRNFIDWKYTSNNSTTLLLNLQNYHNSGLREITDLSRLFAQACLVPECYAS